MTPDAIARFKDYFCEESTVKQYQSEVKDLAAEDLFEVFYYDINPGVENIYPITLTITPATDDQKAAIEQKRAEMKREIALRSIVHKKLARMITPKI